MYEVRFTNEGRRESVKLDTLERVQEAIEMLTWQKAKRISIYLVYLNGHKSKLNYELR